MALIVVIALAAGIIFKMFIFVPPVDQNLKVQKHLIHAADWQMD